MAAGLGVSATQRAVSQKLLVNGQIPSQYSTGTGEIIFITNIIITIL